VDCLRPVGRLHASNVLKWYWWRFNGYGYFWGMVTGIASALGLPSVITQVPLVQHLLATIPSTWKW
jgi:Na+(H+)/acetate symporter ActP